MQSKDNNPSVNHIAHDLNNILTRILNSVELLKKKFKDDEGSAALLASIENGTFLASEIIEDLLSESKLKIPRKRIINPNSLITDLINLLNIQLKDRITFHLKLDSALSSIEGRYSDFYRLFLNLIVNASEAIKQKGTISITTRKVDSGSEKENDPVLFDSENFIEIKILDSGEGIDKLTMPYIFNESYSTKPSKKNRGVGLTIVKKIVDDNGGVIKVTSERGKGTEFTLKFPAKEYHKPSKISTQKTILIAEDEDVQRELLTELLESYNYNVIASSSGTETIARIKKGIPDLLIIDQLMPDMDGLACIKKIKKLKCKSPIILASGTQDFNFEEVKKSVNRVISKPYNFEEMLTIIRELTV